MSTKFPVSPLEAITATQRCMKNYIVPILMSSPAMGKSSIYAQLADSMKLKLIDVRPAHMDVVEFNGYPDLTGEFATYKPIDLFPTEKDVPPDGYNGWLVLFDELPQAEPDVQGALHKVILDRKIGQHKLHPHAFCVAAGNYSTDRAASNKIISSMQSRMVHLHLRNDLVDFAPYMNKMNFSPLIQAFLPFKPDLLNNFDPNHTEDTFASQRTWEMLNNLIKDRKVEDGDTALIAGTIGAPAATEFMAFSKVWGELPDVETIKNNPKTAHIPDTPITQYALAGMLSTHVNDENVSAFCQYMSRMTNEQQLVFVRISFRKSPSLYRDSDFSALLRKFSQEMAAYA